MVSSESFHYNDSVTSICFLVIQLNQCHKHQKEIIVGYYMVWKDLYGAGTFNTAKRIFDIQGIVC